MVDCIFFFLRLSLCVILLTPNLLVLFILGRPASLKRKHFDFNVVFLVPQLTRRKEKIAINFEIDHRSLVSMAHNSVSVNIRLCSTKILLDQKQRFLFM